MIDRYINKAVALIWRDETKTDTWQQVELAVIEARARLGLIPRELFTRVRDSLAAPTNLEWWRAKEKETNHDLQAWVAERVRHLAHDLKPSFHEGMTSYDTEETAFLIMLKNSASLVTMACEDLEDALRKQAVKYRYCPMMGVTHGQHAEIQTFGKRCLTWLQEIALAKQRVATEANNLRFSRLSGAIGSYGGVTPEVEVEALKILGFEPFYGATQILPRQLHVPLASSLAILVSVISKIGTDIRLGARSPRPIYQEPFGKAQTGSSRMPHKRNPINCEQLEGMQRMALGYLQMIMQNITTDEERAIEQSSVERVAWPDLFHVAMRSLSVCTKVISGLQVYPDRMMLDIVDTCGTWAAGAVKEFLRTQLVKFGVNTEETYRIVQLASFVAFAPGGQAVEIRANPSGSFAEANRLLSTNDFVMPRRSIQHIIEGYGLVVVEGLSATPAEVEKWNNALRELFTSINPDEWKAVFSIEARLKDEDCLFQNIIDDRTVL